MFEGALLLGRSFRWHYTRGVVEVVRFWSGLTRIVWHFFSVPLLAATFLEPLTYGPPPGEPAQGVVSFSARTILRILGASVRTVVIAVGAMLTGLTALGGALATLAWLCFHLILALLFLAIFVLLVYMYIPQASA